MSPCNHPRLIQIQNPEMGGIATTYQCLQCKNLLTVTIAPMEIEIQFGTQSTI